MLVVVEDDATGDDSGVDELDDDLDGGMMLVTDVIWTYKGVFFGQISASLVHRIE